MTEVIQLPRAEPTSKPSGLWQTQAALAISALIDRTRVMGDICMITGPSGSGKTTAARSAATTARSRASEPTTYFVSMTKASEGLQAGILRIANAIGMDIPPHTGSSEAFHLLTQCPWEPETVLLIDEAQYMSDALLHGVRDLWDTLDQKGIALGIVLIGTPDLADRIKGRAKQRGRAFDPLMGRIGAAVALDPLGTDDVAAICRHYGLSGAAAEKMVLHVVRSAGGLHNARRMFAQAERLAPNGGRITLLALKQVVELAGVGS